MIDDANEAAHLVTREVLTGARDGEPTKILLAHRTYPVGRAQLWDALTNPERIGMWLRPIEGDLQEGGEYHIQNVASGVIQKCDPDGSFTVTWDGSSTSAWVKVTLEDVNGDTQLHLAHEAPMDPDLWGEFGPGVAGIGWEITLLGLGIHLENGEALNRNEVAEFPKTEAGQRFIEIAAVRWAEAAIADGDETDPAQDAAGRSVRFYTEGTATAQTPIT